VVSVVVSVDTAGFFAGAATASEAVNAATRTVASATLNFMSFFFVALGSSG